MSEFNPAVLERPREGDFLGRLRLKVYIVIFESETRGGRAFDIVLIWAILANILVAALESVASMRAGRVEFFRAIEWAFTGLFTCEYLLRLFSHRHPWKYAFSLFGLVDLLSIFPTYFSLLYPGSQALAVVRIFRILRLFRIFKLIRYMREARVLLAAIQASRPKITVFLVALFGIVVTMGAMMYLIEGEKHGFTSIPKSIYWAIITLTTVGYGDLVPKTVLGQGIASLVMIMGYSILAVPTGIVTAEIAQASRLMANDSLCPACGRVGHDPDARYCKACGQSLDPA
jgi:voltage-gated potassium channel